MQLGQSPFLNILSDRRVRETLQLMGRPPNERVTRDVARELCIRTGSKAILAGSISNLGVSTWSVWMRSVAAPATRWPRSRRRRPAKRMC